jgi:pimeloyl-ACP methyl ester carboxylesterase
MLDHVASSADVAGSGGQIWAMPPSTNSSTPLTKLASSEARNTAAFASDLRGMGASGKPAGGYDKKTMAADIHALVRHLGYDKADVLGHDIGSQVAYAYAANFPQATGKLVMLDVPHPDAGLATWPLLPQADTIAAIEAFLD